MRPPLRSHFSSNLVCTQTTWSHFSSNLVSSEAPTSLEVSIFMHFLIFPNFEDYSSESSQYLRCLFSSNLVNIQSVHTANDVETVFFAQWTSSLALFKFGGNFMIFSKIGTTVKFLNFGNWKICTTLFPYSHEGKGHLYIKFASEKWKYEYFVNF